MEKDYFSELLNTICRLDWTGTEMLITRAPMIFILWYFVVSILGSYALDHIAGPPQRVLSGLLHSFVDSSHGGLPFRPAQLPMLGLSEGDKRCIRDRSTIMARHFFADKSEDFINAQVCAIFCYFHAFDCYYGFSVGVVEHIISYIKRHGISID